MKRFFLFLILAASIGISANAQDPTSKFRFAEREGKFLDLFEGDQPVLTYVYGMNLAKNAPADRERSSYIHPLYGVDGEVLTDDFPRDHYHHRGVFWAWQQIFWNEKKFSMWDIRGIEQRFEKWLEKNEAVPPPASPHATFAVQNGWYVGGEKIVDEKVKWEIFPQRAFTQRGGQTSRLLTVRLQLQAVDKDVVLKGEWEKGYGGMGIRFAPRTDTTISTSAGVHAIDGLMLRHRYVDFSAKFEGKDTFSGVTLIPRYPHPDYPPAWILRHYGYIGLCWPGLEEYTLKKDNPLELEYWLIVHNDKGEPEGWRERMDQEFKTRLQAERENTAGK